MLQYKIPQNVEREDYILYFLTMRQLGILAVGGVILYVLYSILSAIFFVEIWGPVIFIGTAITAAMAFLEINKMSFSRWILLMMQHHLTPKKRIWDHRHSVDNEMKAMLRTIPKEKIQKKGVEVMAALPQKTLVDLVSEIDMNKASYKKTGLSFTNSSDLFDEEDEKSLQNLENLSNLQKKAVEKSEQQKSNVNMSTAVNIQKKGELSQKVLEENIVEVKIPTKEKKPELNQKERDDTYKAIHKEALDKIKGVRPDLEIQGIEDHIEAETDKILQAALARIYKNKEK